VISRSTPRPAATVTAWRKFEILWRRKYER
jgi:hypothetical protein